MPPVVEKVTEESAVVPVQAVLKEDAPEPLAVEPVEEKEELETVPTPEPAPTPAKAAPVAAYTCPYCTSFKGTKVGLSHHVRVVHPTEYGSFKEEAKS
jgi:hypothetical protein